MSLYVDSSALLKRYIDEKDSSRAEQILLSDETWITGQHTLVEVRRNLVRLLDPETHTLVKRRFNDDWQRMHVVALDEVTCEMASNVAEALGVRSLDALHLAAAQRAGQQSLGFLTFDLRLAQSARTLGFVVHGA
jgi:uncharacterized protein